MFNSVLLMISDMLMTISFHFLIQKLHAFFFKTSNFDTNYIKGYMCVGNRNINLIFLFHFYDQFQ